MRLSLLMSLLLHSLAVSSLKPPSVASLLRQNDGVSLVNLTTATNVTTTASAANINLAATIEEGLQMVYRDDILHGADLVSIWLNHPLREIAPYPTSLLNFRAFELSFLLNGRDVKLDYDDWGGDGYWDGPRLGDRTGDDQQKMQWAELQSLVSLAEADRLMTTAGYGGRHITWVNIDAGPGGDLGYYFAYMYPKEGVYLNAVTREITIEDSKNGGSLSEE